jgi:hypothetical protein
MILFSEYPYKFVKVLRSQQIVEKEQITLVCELDDAGGEVTWHKNNEVVKPDKRYVLMCNIRVIYLFVCLFVCLSVSYMSYKSVKGLKKPIVYRISP